MSHADVKNVKITQCVLSLLNLILYLPYAVVTFVILWNLFFSQKFHNWWNCPLVNQYWTSANGEMQVVCELYLCLLDINKVFVSSILKIIWFWRHRVYTVATNEAELMSEKQR